MNDSELIRLYFKRNESAITETDTKYGTYCRTISSNILKNHEDAEECVNETWLKAWESIPPQEPSSMKAFLGKITRNLSISRWRKENSEKRVRSEASVCLDELSECIPDPGNGGFTDDSGIKDALDRFLEGTQDEPRKIFMLRYWYVFSVKEIAQKLGMSSGAVKMSLMRTRRNLKKFLAEEGIEL